MTLLKFVDIQKAAVWTLNVGMLVGTRLFIVVTTSSPYPQHSVNVDITDNNLNPTAYSCHFWTPPSALPPAPTEGASQVNTGLSAYVTL